MIATSDPPGRSEHLHARHEVLVRVDLHQQADADHPALGGRLRTLPTTVRALALGGCR